MLCRFVFQVPFDCVSMYPITPNTSLLKYLEDRIHHYDPPDESPLKLRTCLSEESGYAWLSGAAVRGRRTMMAQGSQSLAQLYEFMNISPGLHLPIFLLELTRAISPGTTIKPDHTATLRTSDTGEIVLFGRGLQDNYHKALLLLKLMESDGVWLPGRLVIKGFVETHALSSMRQAQLHMLSDEAVHRFLGRPTNPFVFSDQEDRSVGILDFDARYAEQRQGMDQVLTQAGEQFDRVARQLATLVGGEPIRKVERSPADEEIDIALVSLNDPDLGMAELVAESLRAQGVSAGVVAINLYRPFPAEQLRDQLKGTRAVAVIEYDSWSGRAGGGVLAQEVRSALYDTESAPEIIAVQMGLGGRAVTVPYVLTLFRMLADLAERRPDCRTRRWLAEHAPSSCFALGTRGNPIPETSSTFDVPLAEEGVYQTVVVGKGGQGLLVINAIMTAVSTLRDQCTVAMVGYGALQRGGGVTLSLKTSDNPIQDHSDVLFADTLLAVDADIHLEAMLPQLTPGGTLILDADLPTIEQFRNRLAEGSRVIPIPAKAIARQLYGASTRVNLIMLGALLADSGVASVDALLGLLDQLDRVDGISKEAAMLEKPKNRQAVVTGYLAYRQSTEGALEDEIEDDIKDEIKRDIGQGVEQDTEQDINEPSGSIGPEVETVDQFVRRIVPRHMHRALQDPRRLKRLKWIHRAKKRLYRTLFLFHPIVNQIQSMYLHLQGRSPVGKGDMACAGCGQINIFRTLFDYLQYLKGDEGNIYVSEQDGCGTVFSGLNRTSIWNLPYIRIAFETAHGVAAGLAHGREKNDFVVSISGDGGMMQGLRSMEDSLHQQDPIFHIVVVNQALGNTGGQATASTMRGATTREGHVSRQEPLNFLKFAEKYGVPGAVASTVHLGDLQRKIRWGFRVVHHEHRPFLLVMHFSCLEQGINLARSMGAQKMAMDAHFFNLYSLDYKDVKSPTGKLYYRQKRITIDWFPWVFGKRWWKKNLKAFYGFQATTRRVADDDILLEEAYWQLRGQWQELAREMGPLRYGWAFFKSFFSISRATMARLIKKQIPPEAEL